MDVLAPTDRVETLIMALPQSFLHTLNDPVTQSLGMAVLGLLSFGLMGVGLFWPHAYSHVSALHLLIRIGLLTGLCAYVYHELILKRCATAGAKRCAKPHAHADADADADADAAVDAAPAAAAALKPRRRLAPVAEAAEPVATPAAAPVAVVAAAAAAAEEERPQRHDEPLPDWLRANAELCGADSAFAPLPVPASRRSNSLLFDALNHNGMLTSAYAFVHRTFFAAPAKAARAAAVAATTDPLAAAAAGDAAAAAAAATAGADAKQPDAAAAAAAEYPEVVGVFGVGEKVCGHPAIVHGGMTATLLDQVLGIATFVALPKRICFTANLNMNYRKPLPAGTKVAVRARATKIDGRKLHASGRVELLGDPNTVFADANALFIMPK